jgi:hypothetical protein
VPKGKRYRASYKGVSQECPLFGRLSQQACCGCGGRGRVTRRTDTDKEISFSLSVFPPWRDQRVCGSIQTEHQHEIA